MTRTPIHTGATPAPHPPDNGACSVLCAAVIVPAQSDKSSTAFEHGPTG